MPDIAGYTLAAGDIAGVASVVTAFISGFFVINSSKNQVKSAKIASETQISLQRDKIDAEQTKDSELSLYKAISDLYICISELSFKYSIGSQVKVREHKAQRKDLWVQYELDRINLLKCISGANMYIVPRQINPDDLNEPLNDMLNFMDHYYWERDGMLEAIEKDGPGDEEREELKSRKVTQFAIDIGRRSSDIKKTLDRISSNLLKGKGLTTIL